MERKRKLVIALMDLKCHNGKILAATENIVTKLKNRDSKLDEIDRCINDLKQISGDRTKFSENIAHIVSISYADTEFSIIKEADDAGFCAVGQINSAINLFQENVGINNFPANEEIPEYITEEILEYLEVFPVDLKKSTVNLSQLIDGLRPQSSNVGKQSM